MNRARFNEILGSLSTSTLDYVDCSALDINDEQLGALIVMLSQCPADIKTLNLSSNCITSDGIPGLVEFLHSSNVNEVFLSKNKVDDVGAHLFLSLFQNEEHPSMLDLSDNQCSPSIIGRLNFLTKSNGANASLQDAALGRVVPFASFADYIYADLDIKFVRYVLQEVKGLECVDFSNSDIGDGGLGVLGDIIKDSKVAKFVFSNCGVGNMGFRSFILSANLPHHAFISVLDFSRNIKLTNECTNQLLTMVFNTNNVLVELDFAETGITSDACSIVKEECLLNQQPPALKKAVVALRTGAPESVDINLQWEENMGACVHFMWKAIRESLLLEYLNVSNTGINDDDMKLLGEALRRGSKLRVIEIANNAFTSHGVASFFTVLQRGTCAVEEVNLANNDLNDSACSSIIAAVRANSRLKVLNLEANPKISSPLLDEIAGLTAVNRSPPAIRCILPLLERNAEDVTIVDLAGKDSYYNDEVARLLSRALLANTHVRKVNLSNNNIGNAGISFLANTLERNSTIAELDLSRNCFGNRGVEIIGRALEANQAIQTLNLSDNTFDDDGLAGYPAMLRKNYCLREVLLERTRVSVNVATAIKTIADLNRAPAALKLVVLRVLDGDTTLAEINLSEDRCQFPLDDNAVTSLCSSLHGKSFVQRLNLRGNSIGVKGCAQVAGLLSEPRCAIHKINLSKNPITDLAVAELAKSFKVNHSLELLNLGQTELTATAAALLVEALKANDRIKVINLPDNIDPAAAEAVERALLFNNQPLALKRVAERLNNKEPMDTIDLSNQVEPPFGDVACQLLCSSLHANTTLKALNLSGNCITSASCAQLAGAIGECPQLTSVDLSHNRIDSSAADTLQRCIESHACLKTLNLDGNAVAQSCVTHVNELLELNSGSPQLKRVLLQHMHKEKLDDVLNFDGKVTNYLLDDADVVRLARVLSTTENVRVLDLSSNQFSDVGCVALGEVLRVNHSLESLSLAHNPIGAEGGEGLFYALRINPQLRHLDLTGTAIPSEVLEDIASVLHVNQTKICPRIDMCRTTLDEVDDRTQFNSTDYMIAQTRNLSKEAIRSCKHANTLRIE